MEKKIIVKKRSNDYHAHLEGNPDIWGCGDSYGEAIGDLVWTHQAEFNIEVKMEKRQDG